MKLEQESLGLTIGDVTALSFAARAATSVDNALQAVSDYCQNHGLWAYAGGNHIAVHRETGRNDKGERLAIIT